MKKILLIIIGMLAVGNILVWQVVFSLANKNLEVTFFDVGQGDSAFIETPQGHQILIDGGPDSTVIEKLSKEMPFYDRTIDLIILSHPDSDHINGLVSVLENYKVQNILWAGINCDTSQCNKWNALLKAEGANIYIAQHGESFSFSEAIAQILYPLQNLEEQKFKDANNTSVVVRFDYGSNSFLLMGDLYQEGEIDLVNSSFNIDADVLKVGHHGSKSSSAQLFIEKVSPVYGVISCGKDNKYGHPHIEALEVLENYDTTILRTDLNGNIKIFSDGKNLSINN